MSLPASLPAQSCSCHPRGSVTFHVRHFFLSLRCFSNTASSCSFRTLRAFRVDRPRAKGGSPCREIETVSISQGPAQTHSLIAGLLPHPNPTLLLAKRKEKQGKDFLNPDWLFNTQPMESGGLPAPFQLFLLPVPSPTPFYFNISQTKGYLFLFYCFFVLVCFVLRQVCPSISGCPGTHRAS